MFPLSTPGKVHAEAEFVQFSELSYVMRREAVKGVQSKCDHTLSLINLALINFIIDKFLIKNVSIN